LPKKRYVHLVSTPKVRIFGLNPRASGGYEKTGILLFDENKKTLERIRRAGLRISCLVAHDDGCSHSGEGGQNDCVLEPPFFKKVLENADPNGLKLILNHSPIRELDDLITTGQIGDKSDVKIGGTWYDLILTGDSVWGLHDARRVFLQKKSIQEPTHLFLEDEIQGVFFRTLCINGNERVV
jgi:hypothetical protein